MRKQSKNPEKNSFEYKLLEEALHESEMKFRYFVEAAADGIITADGMGNIVSWNSMARKMFGYKDKDVVGKPLTILMPERYIPGHTKGVNRFIETGKSNVIGTVYEVHGLRKDGTEFPVELSLASWELKKGRFFVGILRDITKRKEAEEAVRESEVRFHSIWDSSVDGMVLADDDGTIFAVNKAFCELVEMKEEELVGQPMTVTMSESGNPAQVLAQFRKLFEEPNIEPYIQRTANYKSGKTVDLEIGRSFIKLDQQRLLLGILRDVTEKKEAFENLEKANTRLRETQAQLVQSEKMASLGMLVAGVAHEINTPLGAVMSMHDTLIRGVNKMKGFVASSSASEITSNDNVQKIIEIIDDADEVINSGNARIEKIVKQLKSFARLDEAELQEADVNECLEETIKLFKHELKENVKLTKNFSDLPEVVCYPAKLNQVFLNLLINANQAIDGKGEISINTYTENGNICIAIMDNGEGIPKKSLDKIFDPGFTTKGVGVGTGLGLSISYRIIQEHEGDISVESNEGDGSTFKITIPIDLESKLEQ